MIPYSELGNRKFPIAREGSIRPFEWAFLETSIIYAYRKMTKKQKTREAACILTIQSV